MNKQNPKQLYSIIALLMMILIFVNQPSRADSFEPSSTADQTKSNKKRGRPKKCHEDKPVEKTTSKRKTKENSKKKDEKTIDGASPKQSRKKVVDDETGDDYEDDDESAGGGAADVAAAQRSALLQRAANLTKGAASATMR